MKQTLFILFLFGLSLFTTSKVVAQQNMVNNALLLKESAFDFGRIPQGKPVYHVFEIKNTGKTTLQLTDVQASCGCTTPVWQREAILPGATTSIKVGYNAADAGYFEKTITVTYGQGENLLMTIRGDVWKTPDQPAPPNKSLELLKKIKINY